MDKDKARVAEAGKFSGASVGSNIAGDRVFDGQYKIDPQNAEY